MYHTGINEIIYFSLRRRAGLHVTGIVYRIRYYDNNNNDDALNITFKDVGDGEYLGNVRFQSYGRYLLKVYENEILRKEKIIDVRLRRPFI
jgi:hypothetical protein